VQRESECWVIKNKKPLAVRLFHWSVVLLVGTSFVTGYVVFDFQLPMDIWVRDALFALHRACGLISALMMLLWLAWRIRGAFRFHDGFQGWSVRFYHVVLATICIVTPTLPWIARSLDGRTNELFNLLPQYNLVSAPTNPWTYQLIQYHRLFIQILLVLIAIHLVAVLVHVFHRKDGTLRSMIFK